MGSIIWDKGGHVVRRAVASQAGTVVAAVSVMAGGVLPTDLSCSYLTLILIWKKKKITLKHRRKGVEIINVIISICFIV